MLTENDLSLEEMKRAVARGYLCVECQNLLTIAWGGAYKVDGYVLRCGNDINHKGITRHDIKEEKLRREYFSMDSKALTEMDTKTMLARVNMARFPKDMTQGEKNMLAEAAITYGFDPIMGEISIYQGNPYISIDGRYRKAQETGKLDGVETRPATKQEREDWQIPDGDYFFRSDVYVKGVRRPFTGWGRVRGVETMGGKGFKPIETNPQRMAEKRAEAQALRKAFHIPLPSIEEIGFESEPPVVRIVDVTTGEIKEPEHKPETSPDATQQAAVASKATSDSPVPKWEDLEEAVKGFYKSRKPGSGWETPTAVYRVLKELGAMTGASTLIEAFNSLDDAGKIKFAEMVKAP